MKTQPKPSKKNPIGNPNLTGNSENKMEEVRRRQAVLNKSKKMREAEGLLMEKDKDKLIESLTSLLAEKEENSSKGQEESATATIQVKNAIELSL
jgi:hypothetical protein